LEKQQMSQDNIESDAQELLARQPIGTVVYAFEHVNGSVVRKMFVGYAERPHGPFEMLKEPKLPEDPNDDDDAEENPVIISDDWSQEQWWDSACTGLDDMMEGFARARFPNAKIYVSLPEDDGSVPEEVQMERDGLFWFGINRRIVKDGEGNIMPLFFEKEDFDLWDEDGRKAYIETLSLYMPDDAAQLQANIEIVKSLWR